MKKKRQRRNEDKFRKHWSSINHPNIHEKKTYNQESSAQQSYHSFRIEGEIKSFPDKQKLKEVTTTKLALQDKLKGLL